MPQTTITVNMRDPDLFFVDADPAVTLDLERGEDGAFSFDVGNRGTADMTYVFQSTYPEGLNIQVVLDDGVYERPLAAGAQETINGHVLTEPTTPTGPINIIIDIFRKPPETP